MSGLSSIGADLSEGTGPIKGLHYLENKLRGTPTKVTAIRASYFQETEAWVEHLTKDLGISRIAILYQDDAFGLAGLDGVKRAMAKRGLSLVATGAFVGLSSAWSP